MSSHTKSRLEVNFIRLLEETQAMASGSKQKNWTFNKEERPSLLVAYGSETGTAQELAERIGREAYRFYLNSSVMPMNNVPLRQICETEIAVFVAATTGQGEEPENMKMFFQNLWDHRKERNLLSSLKFGVIGLGDSSYQKFNYSSKRLYNLIKVLGGTPLQDIALGDDQHELGPDYVVGPWLKQLWEKILLLYPLPLGISPVDKSVLLPLKFRVVFVNKESSPVGQTAVPRSSCYCAENPYMGKITWNTRKTSSDHFQDVRLIEFDVSDIDCVHSPGYVLMIQPQNLDEHVDEFLAVTNYDGSEMFCLQKNDANSDFPFSYILPQPCTIRQCVKSYFNIMALPNRYFFEVLASITEDEMEKEKFLEFASPEGQEEFYNYVTRPRRTIMEVLSDFPRTKEKIHFESLFGIIPPIKPRAYSIASAYRAHPGKVQILVAVLKYKTNLKRIRLGMCSNWLAGLETGSIIPMWIKKGTFKFPSSLQEPVPPVIMIGPGTGCAPFRAFIEEYRHSNSPGKVLYFGCRNKDKDFFFRDEWVLLAEAKEIELFCAFSRDQEEKIYVQHLMKANAESMWKLINDEKALVYYAGNAKRIPIDVYEALKYVCETMGNMNSSEAEIYMKKVIEPRYQTESWA